MSNEAIARELGVSPSTVAKYLSNAKKHYRQHVASYIRDVVPLVNSRLDDTQLAEAVVAAARSANHVDIQLDLAQYGEDDDPEKTIAAILLSAENAWDLNGDVKYNKAVGSILLYHENPEVQAAAAAHPGLDDIARAEMLKQIDRHSDDSLDNDEQRRYYRLRKILLDQDYV